MKKIVPKAMPVSDAEWIERSKVMNEAIERWTKRPRPEPHFSDLPRPTPKRRQMEYYAGRFVDSDAVFTTLRVVFSKEGWPDIIRAAHDVMYGTDVSDSAKECLEQTIADYANGGRLPPFVLATYVRLKA